MRLTPICFAILVNFGLLPLSVSATQKASINKDDIEVIKVRGTQIEKPLAELTGSVAIVSQRDIRRSVATQMSDLFRREPGISVTGNSGTSQNISIRGMSGNRILMIQDGTRIADGYGAADINDLVGRFNFNLEDVKTIEVAKGAASSLFGAGALAGVVRVTTKQATDYLKNKNTYLSANLLYNGLNNEFKQSITGAKNVMGIPVAISVSHWEGEEQQNYSNSRLPLSTKGQSGRLNSQWEDSNGQLTINVDWLEQEMTNKIKPFSVPQFDGAWLVENQHQAEIQTNKSATLTWQSANSTQWFDDFTAIGFWRTTQHKNTTNQLLLRRVFNVQKRYRQLFNDDRYEQESMGAKLDFAKFTNNHEFLFGLGYEQLDHQRPKVDTRIENGTTTVVQTMPFKSATTKALGAYISDDITFTDKISLLVGVRYDNNQLSAQGGEFSNVDSNKLSASSTLTYDNNQGLKSYVAYAQGYRAAPYDKVYGNIPHLFAIPPFEIIPNPDLKEENSDSFELGLSWRSEGVSISGNVFYTRFDDFIDVIDGKFRTSDGVLEKQFVNIEKAFTYGAELKFEYVVTDALSVNASSGWMKGENESDKQPLRSVTPFEYNIGATYSLADVTFYANFYGQAAMSDVPLCSNGISISGVNCRTSKAWNVFDLDLEYPIANNFLLNLSAKNFFDKRFTRYQDVAGSLGSSDLSQPGRNISASLRYTF